MCISATEGVKIKRGEKCKFNDRDFEQSYVVTICVVRYQLECSKLVAESNFSKLIKTAGVAKSINRKCKAKESRYYFAYVSKNKS